MIILERIPIPKSQKCHRDYYSADKNFAFMMDIDCLAKLLQSAEVKVLTCGTVL